MSLEGVAGLAGRTLIGLGYILICMGVLWPCDRGRNSNKALGKVDMEG